MELFVLEHKKIWRRKIVRISVFLCFLIIVIFGSVLSYQWFSHGSSNYSSGFGNNFDGYSNIRNLQEYGKERGGDLTDEKLRQLVRDYQRIEAAGKEEELKETDWITVNSWLKALWPELEDPGVYQLMISYVKPEQLTGFYERRRQKIEDFLEISGQTGEEREYLLRINEKVREPFRYEWVEGWSQLLGNAIADMGMVAAVFLAIILSTVFAGEWHDNTGSLVLTTKNGWERLAYAKIFAGLAFTLELFILLIAGNVVSQLFFMGTAGWNMPVQNIKLIAIAPMTMLQAEIYEYAFLLLGAIGFAGVVMLISAAVKSNVTAVLLSMAVVYLPMMITEYLPLWAQKALDLLPLVGSPADIFRTNIYHVLRKIIWSPYLLMTIPILLGILCIPLAIRSWSGRLKV